MADMRHCLYCQLGAKVTVDSAFDLLLEAMRTGDGLLFTKAADSFRELLAAGSPGDTTRAEWLSNLSFALQCQFQQAGRPEDLAEALATGRDALAMAPAGDVRMAAFLTNLCGALRLQYAVTRRLADLDEAVTASREAVAQSVGYDDRLVYWWNLADVLRLRYDQTEVPEDLDDAIAAARETVAASGDDTASHTMFLANLGRLLERRYNRTGQLPDLDEAANTWRAAVEACLPGDAASVEFQFPLGAVLQVRHHLTGEPGDLAEAVSTLRIAAELALDHPGRPVILFNLATALLTRFQQVGTPADLDNAVTALEQAVATESADAEWLLTLAEALLIRYQQASELADLDKIVMAYEAALEAWPAEAPRREWILSNLGSTLGTRAERAGSISDLQTATNAFRNALAIAPADQRVGILCNLASSLQRQFELSDDRKHSDEAVAAYENAVAEMPDDYPVRALVLSNFGNCLRVRFERIGIESDIHEAVAIGADAVAATRPDAPNLGEHLSNLANSLRSRYRGLQNPADLDRAIEINKAALATLAADDPRRLTVLTNLGDVYGLRSGRTGSPADLEAALTSLQEAQGFGTAIPRTRFWSAQSYGRALASAGRWSEAVTAFESAILMLGQLAPRNLARDEQENQLLSLSNLASDAAACCVRDGRAERAIELFEQGRGVLLGQALDLRTDLTLLRDQHSELAERFETLRDLLADGPRPGEIMSPSAVSDSATRRRLAGEFDQLIAEIRTLPGFAGFLLPASVGELTEAAAEGPVVVVNVSWIGSHALILTSEGIRTPVPLPDLTVENVNQQVTEYLSALDPTAPPAEAQQRLTDTLGWLWDSIAGPVLTELGYDQPQDGEWPRLWWCLSGTLSLLPLHAAGRHHTRLDQSPQTVTDRVISSYTPTIRALARSRRADTTTGSADSPTDILVVAMPRTPGESALPGAEAEVQLIRKRFGERVVALIGTDATYNTVLLAMASARWAHFACHASPDAANPSTGYLLLEDSQDRRLTVADVSRLRLDDAEFAFLSACSTARPSQRLADEAIHLASAFQLAGYRHVIGTLWPINDRVARSIANDLYAAIASSGTAAVTASALHSVTRDLRDRRADAPSLWASHIHSGV